MIHPCVNGKPQAGFQVGYQGGLKKSAGPHSNFPAPGPLSQERGSAIGAFVEKSSLPVEHSSHPESQTSEKGSDSEPASAHQWPFFSCSNSATSLSILARTVVVV